MTTTESRTDALAFLKSHDLGAIATLSPVGAPRVRLVYYVADDGFNVYVLTLAHTRKADDIRADARAAFTVASQDAKRTIQIEGVFEEMTDTATFGPVLVALTKHLFPEGDVPAPVTRLETDKPALFMLRPTWIRWADFTRAPDAVFEEIAP